MTKKYVCEVELAGAIHIDIVGETPKHFFNPNDDGIEFTKKFTSLEIGDRVEIAFLKRKFIKV